MLSIVFLLACSSIDAEIEMPEGPDAIPMTVKPDGPAQLAIATMPDRTPARRAPVQDPSTPSDAVIVRSECFGGGDLRQRSTTRAPSAPPASSGPRPRPTPRPSPSPAAGGKSAEEAKRAPANPPASDGAASDKGGGEGGGLGQLVGGLLDVATGAAEAPEAEPSPAPPPSAAPPVTAAKDAPGDAAPEPDASARRGAGRDASPDKAQGGEGKADKKGKLEELGYAAPSQDATRTERDRNDRRADAEDQDAPAEELEAPSPILEWGATVYLSNDDSMSLASAQRLLYSMKRGQRPSVSEVRPHELLNYFSVDVAPIEEGRLFSVLGGAEQFDDTLTVSLAVRGASPPRKPMDLTLVVDRSGSMREEGRMDYLKRGLTRMTEELQNGDRVDIVLFDSGVCSPLENFVVGRDDMEILQSTIDAMQPKGSTDLDAGLREAWRIHDARQVPEGTRNGRLMLITDAMLNSGNVDEDLVSEVARRFDDDGVRLTGIGVGRGFNDTMLNKLTEKGKGAYVYLGSEAVVDRVFGPGFDSLTRTIAHDVQFSLELPESLAMERFYGEESSTNAADVQPIHYYAGTTQLFLQDLAVKGGRPVLSDPIRMRIKYRDADTGEPSEEVLHTTVGALLDGDAHNLHKGQALMAFADIATTWAMGASPCGAPLDTYRQRVASLTDDAEIGYTNGLVGGLCNVDMTTVVAPGVAYKVRVDSDIPIAEVGLVCGGMRKSERLSGSDTVASFGSVTPGECTVQLQSTVPLSAAVKVPSTGGDVRCMVRGGRLSCS